DLLDTGFGPVIPISPAEGATAVNPTVAFEWQDAANASTYEIEVATDANFTNIVAQGSVTDTNFSTFLSQSTQYYWRLRPGNAGCSGDYAEAFSFTTGYNLCTDYISTDVPLNISASDVVTVNSTVLIDQVAAIQNVAVSIDITHTWLGDLTVTLISPQGTEVQLFSQDCWSDQDVYATFTDAGTASVCNSGPADAALSGLIIPDEPLSSLNGESPEGEWTLRVFDEFGQDGGAINSWSLNICTIQPAIASIKNNLFADFALYPNPNNGNFTIRFNATGNNDVAVTVYDIRGRKITGQNYANPGGLFEQNISLPEVQQGIYLVHVQQGTSTVTKKLVVK
ncbi:MAG: proprotein convertase P-domain-containing protein, partial [Bacteroidota bacterium]